MAWMQSRDGSAIELLAPDLSGISIEELAHSLARISRFCGHTRTMLGYSVAQHSVLVSQHVPPEHALWGLMHDAHEAIIGDVSSPVKEALAELGAGTAFRELDRRMIDAVAVRWSLPGPMPQAVKRADLEALATERRDFLGKCERPWFLDSTDIRPWPEAIKAWHPIFAAQRFLVRYEELTGDRPAEGAAVGAVSC